ncbi:MAG TPA: tail fiber domain-containing protein [Saprospiraceae bacterium]|nr:tail fiber domain-containing protein [Saprospiraceae bacterium]
MTITSDRRAKKEITQSDLGLDFINDLNPVSYIRIKDQEKSKEYGFIAQEIEAIFLSKGVGKTSFIKVDDKGNYSLRYNDLIAILVKANQELSNKINKQGAVIESLSLKLDKLNRQFKELYNELALKD